MMRLLNTLVFHMSLLRDLLRVLRPVFKRTPDRVYVLHTLPVTTLNTSSPSQSSPISHIFALISTQQDPWCRPLHRQVLRLQVLPMLLLPLPAHLQLQVQAQPARKAEVLTIGLLVRVLEINFWSIGRLYLLSVTGVVGLLLCLAVWWGISDQESLKPRRNFNENIIQSKGNLTIRICFNINRIMNFVGPLECPPIFKLTSSIK